MKQEKKIERFFRKWLAALPAPLSCGRPKGRLSLPALGVAGGVFAHLDLGSPAAWGGIFEEVIRGEHRFGPTRNRAVDLCAQNAQSDCGRRPMQDAHRN